MNTFFGFIASIFLFSTAHADISYVDVKAHHTYLFYVDNGNVVIAPCENWSQVKSRQDCDLNSKEVLFEQGDAPDFFIFAFPRVLPAPVALNPLKINETAMLLHFGQEVGGKLIDRHLELSKLYDDLSSVLKKYPDDTTTQAEIAKTKKEMTQIEISLSGSAGTNPDTVQKDVGNLANDFVSRYIADPKLTELLASKNDGSLAGAFLQIMLSSPKSGKMSFVKVLPGTFKMGDSTEPNSFSRIHPVTITKAFEIQTTEFTQQQWLEIMNAAPSAFRGSNNCSHPGSYGICPNNPVDGVSWDDISKAGNGLLARLNAKNDGYVYRLPTEAEWEYAARGGQFAPAVNTLYSYGNDPAEAGSYISYGFGSTSHPFEVGYFKPNDLGLYDMEGNLNEWVNDFESPYPGTSQIDPNVAIEPKPTGNNEHLLRGGSFRDSASAVTCSYRSYANASVTSNFGFRLVRIKK